MKSFASHSGIMMWSACALGVLAIGVAAPSTAVAADRMVFGEYFMANW